MLKRLIVWVLTGMLGLASAGNAFALFHIFQIVELYSNADGTIQYVEFVGLADFQDQWAGHSMTSTDGVTTNTYNFLTGLPSTATLNKSVLVATQGFANLGIVTPDYIIPDGFLFTTGGTVTFPGMDSVVHAALPTNGILSINRTGATAVNSPKNFAGATSTVPALTLSVAKSGTGSGTVTSSPAGINCGATCSADFGKNNPISLTASPDVGSTFSGWSGACTGTGSCTVTMDTAKSVTASFAASAVDTEAPTVPTGVIASPVSGSQINLMWTASTDNIGVTAYAVYRDGAFRATVNAPTVSFSDTGLTLSVTYSYTVRACDAAGNCSAPSNTASATTQNPPDTQPPTVPTGLTAVPASGSQVDLSWTASTDNVGVAQYRIYRDSALIFTVTGTPPATRHGDTGLAASTPYSYTVAACDAFGNCSAQSTAAPATTLAAGQSAYYPQLEPSFNLIGNSLNITLDVAAIFGNQDPGAAVPGITPNVISVWKWNAAGLRWAFYSPQLTLAEIAAQAASNNYDVLSMIEAGEGYWVNAATQLTLPVQTGPAFSWGGFGFSALPSGFNLITHATTMTPSQFNVQVSTTPPGIGVVPTDNFFSLWAWDAAAGTWYFYSPQMEATGGLPAVCDFAVGHFYRCFSDYNKTLGIGVGFWVDRP